MKLPKLEMDQVLECIFEKVSLMANAAKNRASLVRKNVERYLKGLSFQQNELFGFFGCVLHRKGFLSVEFQRLFSFSLIWRVFFQCNGFLSIQSVYLESTGFLCPMSFIQRFSLESAKLVLTAFKGFSKHATKFFFSRIKPFSDAFVLYKTGSFTAMRCISNVFKQLFVLVQ